MKYTEEQRAIVSLCRKYRDVKVEFDRLRYGEQVARLYIEPHWDRDDFVPYSEVAEWLNTHAKLKSKSAPRQRKAAKIKRHIGLTEEQWAKVDAEAVRQGTCCTAVIGDIINKHFKEV